MYRVFLSHSRRDNAAAQALFRWLNGVDPSLKGQIFLDVNPETGIAPGVRWKSELSRAVDHCEAVVCLISRNWEQTRLLRPGRPRRAGPASARVADLRPVPQR
ncbi:toll/interleukin-1 receptor domain-containing protein [Nocardia niigatensis]